MDDRVQRRLRRHRPQPLRDEHLPADLLGPFCPFFLALGDREREIAVEVLGGTQPRVGRQLAVGQGAKRFSAGGERGGEDRGENEQRQSKGRHGKRPGRKGGQLCGKLS
jgi:hypothetical protein